MEDMTEVKKKQNCSISQITDGCGDDNCVKIEITEQSCGDVSLAKGSGSFHGMDTRQHNNAVNIVVNYEQQNASVTKCKYRNKMYKRGHSVCQLCDIKIMTKNFKRHLRRIHSDFINLLKKYENSSYESTLENLYKTHINGMKVDKNLFHKFGQKRKSDFFNQGSSQKFQMVEGHDENESGAQHDEISHETNSENNACAMEINNAENTTRLICDSAAIQSRGGTAAENIRRLDTRQDKQPALSCQCCASIIDINEYHENILTESINRIINGKCLCMNRESCCCKKIYNKMTMQLNDICTDKEVLKGDLCQHFFKTKSRLGKVSYLCKLCYKYSTDGGQKSLWSSKGVSKKSECKESTAALRDGMKKHLKSKGHASSCMKNNSDKKINNTLQVKCTENFRTAAQFLANNYLPSTFYPSLCSFIEKICTNLVGDDEFVHPLGNHHQCSSSIFRKQKAFYESALTILRNDLSREFPLTASARKFSIATAKTTVYKDARRQAIIATYINGNGVPEERLISVATLKDNTAFGTKDHLKRECSKVINCKNIVSLSTDYPSIYGGSESDLIQQFQSDCKFSNKLIYLPDFCQQVERLLLSSKKSWIGEVISKSSRIAKLINTHPRIASAIKEYSLSCDEVFQVLHPYNNTTYIEYAHLHMKSIINNIDIICDCLPSFIDKDDFDGSGKFILNTIFDPVFRSRLILLNDIFCKIVPIERKSKAIAFGPLDYLKAVSELKEALHLQSISNRTIKIKYAIDGHLKYSYLCNNKRRNVNINLKENMYYSQQSRSQLPTDEQYKLIFNDYIDWRIDIFTNFDNFIKIPMPVTYFHKFLTEQDFSDKKYNFKLLFELINCDFLRCGRGCQGLQVCDCVNTELKSFFHSFHTLDISNPTKKISYFLSLSNTDKIEKLQITNVIRLLEILTLLKSNQASTKRIMSKLNRIVDGKFENLITFGTKNSDIDKFNIIAFLAFNTNIPTIKPDLARHRYINHEHSDALTSKPSNKRKLDLPASIYSKRKKIMDVDIELSPQNSSNSEIDEVTNDVQKTSQRNVSNKKPGLLLLWPSIVLHSVHNYCICNGSVTENNWVACHNKNECSSYIAKKTAGFHGGDWFHLKCASLTKLPTKNTKWFCQLCIETLEHSNIKNEYLTDYMCESI